MTTTRKLLAWGVGLALLASIAVLLVLAAAVASIDDGLILINGEPFSVLQWEAGHWAIALVVTLLVLWAVFLVVLVVVPVVVLLPLLAGTLALVGALAPLLLVAGLVWWMWRLARPVRRAPAVATGATIAG